jgi:hypothetical protein
MAEINQETEEEDRQKPLTLDEILKQEKSKLRRPGKIAVPISVGRGFGNRVKKMGSDYEDEDED